MGLPISVGTQVTGSLVVDAASYVWSQWAPAVGLNQGLETWRLTQLVNTACYWQYCVSTEQGSGAIVASGGLNGLTSHTANAEEGLTMESRYRSPLGTYQLYYNFRPSATTTVRKFWVSASVSETSL